MSLMSAGYYNLSNILYKRLTEGSMQKKFTVKLVIKETLLMLCRVGVQVYLLTSDSFNQSSCSENQRTLIVSVVFSLLCYVRVILYIGQRANIFQSSDGNAMLVFDFIQDHFHKNKLTLVINNRNCDLILAHLANFIKLCKLGDENEDEDG